MPDNFLLVAHAVRAEIDITPYGTAPTFVNFGEGIENLQEALNETVQQYFFFAQHGFASNYVTGMAPAYTCTGRRIIGDPAQDWIFNGARKFGLMAERNTNFRLSVGMADGTIQQYTGKVTIANVTDFGGNTTDGSAVSFEVRFNGKPTIAVITPNASLTVESTAGKATGETVLTVDPAVPVAGAKYVYSYGDEAPTATVGQVLTGWNDFTSGGTYMIPNGDNVTVAAVNVSTSVVVATGTAAVVSKTT